MTFECEPGTLQQHKLETLRELGVTRLSLGIENFNDEILESNGRAHLEEEIYRAYGWARDLGFDQINIDLIAGMVGETWDNWKRLRSQDDRAGARQRDHLPDGAAVQHGVFQGAEGARPGRARPGTSPIGRRSGPGSTTPSTRWPQPATRCRAPTRWCKRPADGKFVYRDSLWHGADMFGTGVASFGHVGGVHVQNVDRWEDYVGRCWNRENCRYIALCRRPIASG